MKREIHCELCGGIMNLVLTFPPTKKHKYPMYRYGCNLCNLTKLIRGGGFADEILEPIWAAKEAERKLGYYEKEEGGIELYPLFLKLK